MLFSYTKLRADGPNKLPLWAIWLLWVVGTSLAAIAGLALADMQVVNLPDADFMGDNGIGPILLWAGGMIMYAGPLVGLAQGAVLWLANRRTNPIIWALVTFVGVLLAIITMLLCTVLLLSVGFGFGVLIAGAVVGAVQFQAFRYFTSGKLWLAASGLGWLGALVAGAFAQLATRGVSGLPYHPAASALQWGVSWLVGAGVYSVITGGALIRLLAEDARLAQKEREDASRSGGASTS